MNVREFILPLYLVINLPSDTYVYVHVLCRSKKLDILLKLTNLFSLFMIIKFVNFRHIKYIYGKYGSNIFQPMFHNVIEIQIYFKAVTISKIKISSLFFLS